MKRARTEDQPAEEAFMLDDLDIGSRAPKIPKLIETPAQQSMSRVTSVDETVKFTFKDSELDELEAYDMQFYDDEWLEDELTGFETGVGVQEAMKQLMYPFSKHEPDLEAEELRRLDAIGDKVEIQRLTGLNVLQDPGLVANDSKVLPTRFVRTWREKHDQSGRPCWLCRSRFVAREFAWMDQERESLFSPASSSIVSRLLPAMFLQLREHSNAIMMSLDIKDAFLQSSSRTPLLFIVRMPVVRNTISAWVVSCQGSVTEAYYGIAILQIS